MGQVFPNPQMPLKQKCLLFNFFKEIIEEDIKHLHDDYKELWLEKWKMQVESVLNRKRKSIGSMQVLKNPNDRLANIVDNLDMSLLYESIKSQEHNAIANWELILFGQCIDFEPYKWEDLLQKERRRENKWHKKLFEKLNHFCPNMQLESHARDVVLKRIATFLKVSYP